MIYLAPGSIGGPYSVAREWAAHEFAVLVINQCWFYKTNQPITVVDVHTESLLDQCVLCLLSLYEKTSPFPEMPRRIAVRQALSMRDCDSAWSILEEINEDILIFRGFNALGLYAPKSPFFLNTSQEISDEVSFRGSKED